MSWDDGKHQKVKSVRLTFDDVINSIEVEYEGTNLQSQRRGTLGTKSDGFTLSLDEYITELTGYYKTTFSGDVITALTFKSNKKTYGTYGNKTRSYFSATAPGNNQIAGFFGTSGNALNSIEVHFAPIPPRGSIQPKPVDPDQPKPVDPDQPKPVDPDQPKPVDPDQPKPVDPDQPKPVDPDQPKPVDPDQPKPVDPDQPKPVDPDSADDTKPVSPAKKEAVGGSKGNTFDDGVFDGVKKVTVGVDEFSVTYIKIEYEKDGNVITREHGTKRGELKEFSVNYPKENITGVGGSFDHIFTYDTTLITSLYFTLSNGFTSPKFGETKGTEFKLENNGGKLVGFHGRGEHAIDAIGAYFDNNSKSTGPETNSESDTRPVSPGKIEAVGGIKGNTFDDGVFDGVKKVTVGVDEFSVTYIKIEYEKDGNVITREHGTKRGELKEFSVDYPKENITAVGGSYDHIFTYDTKLVTSLYFTLSNGFTSPKFGETKGTEFKLEGQNGGKLVGFHGRGEHAIDAIGAYFDNNSKSTAPETNPVSPGKIEPVGGIKGNTFDDGVFDGVKKLTVGADEYSVTYIKIEYEKDGKVITREHGTKRGEIKEFSVDYPKENITAVGGSFDHIFTYDTTLVTSLYFTLSNGFTSPKFGETKGTEFKLEGQNGGKLVGFYGRGEHAIDAIGAYFNNGSKPVGLGTKLGEGDSKPVDTGMKRPVGGSKGNTFDDGVFNGVKKVIVGVDEYSVTYIKIEYEMDGKVITREHGTKRGELKEFVVDYPKENITAVGGSYNHIFNYDTTLITSLYFTLSNGITSPKFGETSGTEFKLEDQNGEKLVGFYGRGDYAIDAIGGHFATGSSGSQKLEPQGGKGGSQKLEPQGGKGGNQWDDGADHEGVAKIYIAAGGHGIENIKFDYVKNGETKEGPFHGVKARGFISTFVINHPEEYLVSVEGWFDSTNIIQGIQFKTNRKTSNYVGYEFEGDGTQISLQVKDKKIIGFHGFADSHLNSLGAYFAPISSSSSLTSA